MVSYYAKPIFTLNAQSYKHETLTSIKRTIKYALNANLAKFLILFWKTFGRVAQPIYRKMLIFSTFIFWFVPRLHHRLMDDGHFT